MSSPITPADVAPPKAAPTEFAPPEFAPTEAAPTEAAPPEFAPTEAAPTEAAPTNVAPTEAAPAEAAPAEFATCPGLYQPSVANDGLLLRLRVPGGLLTVAQCEAIAALADASGNGYIEVTNRANVQIRGLQTTIAIEQLTRLQAVGLASPIGAVDALRNIMCSPTAGIDRQQLLGTRPLVVNWNRYLTTRPDFAVLSPKFSVCFDGGESVSVRDRPNDIGLVAVAIGNAVYFRLQLSLGDRGTSPSDVGVLIRPEEALQVLIAMTEVYCDYTVKAANLRPKPRLRALLQDWGLNTYLRAVAQRLPFAFQLTERKALEQSEAMTNSSLLNLYNPNSYNHLGIHSQRQDGLSYIGCVLLLGRLATQQWRGLATLASQYGSGILRLTPWQNVLLSDIPTTQLAEVQQALEWLGLNVSATHPHSAIVACSGTTGCKSSATNTQADAIALTKYLEQNVTLDCPINIHFSGCEKSCAQHYASDLALLGAVKDGHETYHLYVGESSSDQDDAKFGRSLYQHCPPAQLPTLIAQILQVYKQRRSHPTETFKAFVNRHTIANLKQMFQTSENSAQGVRD